MNLLYKNSMTFVFDYDLFVIGAGSGGLAAAIRAASYGARVAIAEQYKPGGACVNYGCIPEKLLDYAASFNRLEQVAVSYGWKECDRHFDWSCFATAKEKHIQQLNQVHLHHLQDAGVHIFEGQASFLEAHTVSVAGHQVTADKILIAVGAKPNKLDIPGIEHTITWHELYHQAHQPKRLAIVGADPIGVKIAGSLNALGSEVTQIISDDYILPTFDAELCNVIQDHMIRQGVTVLNRTQVKAIERMGDRLHLALSGDTSDVLTVDAVLMDARRTPNLAGLQLENIGLQLTTEGAVRVDEFSRTTHTNVFAIGDCTDRIPLTPSAIAQGRAFADTEFGNKPHAVQLAWVPISLSSHPEAATVGDSEAKARTMFGDDAIECYRTEFRPLLYCLAGTDAKTFLKLVVNRHDSDRVLGVHMVGDGAVEIIQTLAIALKLGATKHDLDTAIGIHPSSAEELFSA
ncbi:MAG TPA: FAD-dependent oxidoreductase [Crinalium sp.]